MIFTGAIVVSDKIRQGSHNYLENIVENRYHHHCVFLLDLPATQSESKREEVKYSIFTTKRQELENSMFLVKVFKFFNFIITLLYYLLLIYYLLFIINY